MNWNRLLSFAGVLFLGFSAQAQLAYDELLHASYEFMDRARIIGTAIGLDREQFNFSGQYGFPLNDQDDQLNLGLNYQGIEWEPEHFWNQPVSVYNAGAHIKWLNHWKNPNWASTISIEGNAVTAYHFGHHTDFQTALSARFHYGKSEKRVWTFGLFYSDQPFGPWVYPVLGVDWRLANRLYFSTILLEHAYLEYAVKPKVWYTGIDLRQMGLSFVFGQFEGFEDSYFTSFSDQFPFSPYVISVFNDVYLKEHFTLFVKAGYLVSRRNRHFSRFNNEFSSIYNREVMESIYLQTGLAFRIRHF
ncbi:MAG: hypothetical protein ACFB10_18460 [Salibacteraceae bacterium]